MEPMETLAFYLYTNTNLYHGTKKKKTYISETSSQLYSFYKKKKKDLVLDLLRRQKDGLAGNRTPDHSHAKGVLYH